MNWPCVSSAETEPSPQPLAWSIEMCHWRGPVRTCRSGTPDCRPHRRNLQRESHACKNIVCEYAKLRSTQSFMCFDHDTSSPNLCCVQEGTERGVSCVIPAHNTERVPAATAWLLSALVRSLPRTSSLFLQRQVRILQGILDATHITDRQSHLHALP